MIFQAVAARVRRQESKRTASHKEREAQSIRWKEVMLQALRKLGTDVKHDAKLLDRLTSLIRKLPEDNFIEALMNMESPKSAFISIALGKSAESSITLSPYQRQGNFTHQVIFQQTSTDDTIIKSLEEKAAAQMLAELEQQLNTFIQNGILAERLSSTEHPFNRILEWIAFLLEKKYKTWIQEKVKSEKTVKMERLCNKLARDLRMFQSFLKMSSGPLIDIFASTIPKSTKIEQIFDNFVTNFFRNHKKVCEVIKKILKCGASKSKQIQLFMAHCPPQAEIETFDIPESLKIEGCYVFTLNSIIQFSNTLTGKASLEKLSEIRSSFYKDIEEYKKRNGVECEKVNGESQLEIFKYLITKLGVFCADIFSQLKFMEVLYGEEEMSFHFDEASYIHSQLSVAMDTIRLNL